MDVDLYELDDALLADLLDAAVAGAHALEVMPPVDGPPGWTDERRAAFLEFHRDRSVATPEPVETTYAIVVDGTVVGAARLEPLGEAGEASGAGDAGEATDPARGDAGEATDSGRGAVEAGIWVTRHVRGTGVALAALRELLARAEGRRVVATTTVDNAGALGLLHALGVHVDGGVETDGDVVHAELPTLET